MSVAKNIKNQIKNIPLCEPFTSSYFLTLGTRASIDKTMFLSTQMPTTPIDYTMARLVKL